MLHHPRVPTFHYVYILVSESHPDRYYTGVTSDLSRRLFDRNTGRNQHTVKYRPWRIETAGAFRSKE